MGRFSGYGLFFREFVTNYHTTGAVMPSGPFLARALARYVKQPSTTARRILEVGPGTGAVTGSIVNGLGADDRFDLVELNERFVGQLRNRFDTDPTFQRVAERTRVLHCAIQDLPKSDGYDLIVSGLPLNNFSVELVQEILDGLTGLLNPGGTLSFFEYIAIRAVKSVVSGRNERERLRGIGYVTKRLFTKHEIHRDWIWPNVPPAWVHHIRF